MTEVARGLTGLVVALYFFAWAGFDWAFVLAAVAFTLTGGHLFLRTTGDALPDASFASQLRAVFGPIAAGWQLLALVVVLAILLMLSAIRIAALSNGGIQAMAGSDAECWLPLLLTALVPVWFVISGVLNRLPRHLLAGAIGFTGALAGPLFGLAWRDSLALAAAVMGLVLIADGGVARAQSCRPAR